ncbi:hypothetical protein BU25DRAFT_130013 [Macroventuria anomochaeta]|uniref:Uncharacterized protein n=1 Tax=Macroventuria anomochaeta TaxID=301207 RepID=A0ACB6RT69_9PLEO|nr:uncharacterized protein BU25DRAFT_130013 [Macroventuria anomochaeta]KAF2624993.1 hypothetical protein BU25DRAFT_130013 [Macroventuria anomochaeta]
MTINLGAIVCLCTSSRPDFHKTFLDLSLPSFVKLFRAISSSPGPHAIFRTRYRRDLPARGPLKDRSSLPPTLPNPEGFMLSENPDMVNSDPMEGAAVTETCRQLRCEERAPMDQKARSDCMDPESRHAQEQPHLGIPRALFCFSGGPDPMRFMLMRDMSEHKMSRCVVCCHLSYRISSRLCRSAGRMHQPLPPCSECSLPCS